MSQMRAKSLKVTALVAAALHRASRGQDVGADARPRQMPTEMLELVLPVALRQLLQSKANQGGDL